MGDNYTRDNSRFVVRMLHDSTFQVEIKAQCRGGPLTTLKALAGTMEAELQQNKDGGIGTVSTVSTELQVKEQVITSLQAVGASPEFCEFFAEALQCEHDMISTIYRLQQALKFDRRKPPNPAKLLKAIQDLLKSFNSWRALTDQLVLKSKDIPGIILPPYVLANSKILRALCSLETSEVNLRLGEPLTIMDASQPNKLRIRDSSGHEGDIPTLCCVLPTPDHSALNTADRLRVQLLASWTESVKKTQSLLLESLNGHVRYLAAEWKLSYLNGTAESGSDRVTRRFKRILDTVTKQQQGIDLNKLHNTLFSLERELGSYNSHETDIAKMIETVASLDKSVLCHQMMHKQWQTYRRALEQQNQPIRIVDELNDLRVARPGKSYKYFEVKMTHESVETIEEILFVNNDKEMSEARGDQWTKHGGSRQSVKADHVTSTGHEEKKRYIIRSVTDPRTNKEISIKDAIDERVVIMERGIYVNPDNGHYLTIPEAMAKQFIKVDYVSTRKSVEKTTAIGLITVKTRVDDKMYEIESVIDSYTGERLSCHEARLKGVIDTEAGYYVIGATGERIILDSAIEGGWVIPAYDPEKPEYDIKTYAVSAVVDQRQRKKVPFIDAVRRGLIEKNTGNYVNNVTGEKVYVTHAIDRGFLKAKQIDDPTGLNIDVNNLVVVENIDKIRKNVLKPLGVLKAMTDGIQGENGVYTESEI